MDRVVEVVREVEIPVEVVVYRDRPVEVVREVPVEVVKEVVVEKVIYRDQLSESTYTAPALLDPTDMSGVWIATNDSLYVMRDPERPDVMEFAGSFKGYFASGGLQVSGIDFDSEGRLWIAAKRFSNGPSDGGHPIYRLDDLANPHTAVKVASQYKYGDNFMNVEPIAEIVVDDEDTVWVVDVCSRMRKVTEDGKFPRPSQDLLLIADSYAKQYCQHVRGGVDVYEGVAYATAHGEIHRIPNFGYSGKSTELGRLPDRVMLSGFVADANGRFWGWRAGTSGRNARPRQWWTIGDIYSPSSTAQMVGRVPEDFPVIRGTATYTGTRTLVSN